MHIVNIGANDILHTESNKQSEVFKLPLEQVHLSVC